MVADAILAVPPPGADAPAVVSRGAPELDIPREIRQEAVVGEHKSEARGKPRRNRLGASGLG